MIGALLATCVLASPGLWYTVQIIGPSSGPYGTEVRALNDEGAVVGRTETGTGANYAFVWQSGRFRWLDFPPGYWGGARDINNRGDVVGKMSNGGRYVGVLWTAEGDRVLFGIPGRDIEPQAINENRWVTGWVDYPRRGIGPFVWKGGGEVIPLGFISGPPSNDSKGYEINEGNVIVGMERGPDYPFIAWTWSEQRGLKPFFGGLGLISPTYLSHINDLGDVLAFWNKRRADAVWRDGAPTRVYPGFQLFKINNRGEVLAVNNNDQTGYWLLTRTESFRISDRILPLGEWTFGGTDLNHRGQILGGGRHIPTGRSYRVLLTPVEGTPRP